MTTTAKNPVTRASLFTIASKAETTLDHLTALITASEDKLSNLRRDAPTSLILAETDRTLTFLDAAGLYIKSLEDAIDAMYKQAWAMPNTEDDCPVQRSRFAPWFALKVWLACRLVV